MIAEVYTTKIGYGLLMQLSHQNLISNVLCCVTDLNVQRTWVETYMFVSVVIRSQTCINMPITVCKYPIYVNFPHLRKKS